MAALTNFMKQLNRAIFLFIHDFMASGLTLFLNHYLLEQEW